MLSPYRIVGILGNIISCGLFLSPIPTFYSIYEKGAVEDFSHNPYLVTVLNCALWIYYGIVHPDGLLVVTINGFGLAIELIYVAFYVIYASKKQRQSVGKKILGVLILCALVMLSLTFTPNPEIWRGKKIDDPKSAKGIAIGVLCVAANIAMYVSPCDKLYQVYKTNSVKYMPFWLSLAGFLNGGCWLAYALLKFDAYILTSNSVGCAFSIIQLSVYAYYYLKYPQSKNNKVIDEKADGGGKVELSDIVKISIRS